MYHVEELRRGGWAAVSAPLSEQDARTCAALLHQDRPLRAYRVQPV